MTSLLDVFKEADLRIWFTDVFRSATAWENLDREVIQVLLSLYGLGSNAGTKRMSAGQRRTNFKDLLYIRRRYINKDQLRAAIREVVNATLRARSPNIWPAHVIENWNNVNDFIFFGKGGEMASNHLDDQEIGMLCLHLI